MYFILAFGYISNILFFLTPEYILQIIVRHFHSWVVSTDFSIVYYFHCLPVMCNIYSNIISALYSIKEHKHNLRDSIQLPEHPVDARVKKWKGNVWENLKTNFWKHSHRSCRAPLFLCSENWRILPIAVIIHIQLFISMKH